MMGNDNIVLDYTMFGVEDFDLLPHEVRIEMMDGLDRDGFLVRAMIRLSNGELVGADHFVSRHDIIRARYPWDLAVCVENLLNDLIEFTGESL